MKGASFQVIGVQEGLENAKGVESLFKKIITENFLNLEEDTYFWYKMV